MSVVDDAGGPVLNQVSYARVARCDPWARYYPLSFRVSKQRQRIAERILHSAYAGRVRKSAKRSRRERGDFVGSTPTSITGAE